MGTTSASDWSSERVQVSPHVHDPAGVQEFAPRVTSVGNELLDVEKATPLSPQGVRVELVGPGLVDETVRLWTLY